MRTRDVGSSSIMMLPGRMRASHMPKARWPLLALQDTLPEARLRMEVTTSHHAAPGSTLRDQAGRATRASSGGGGRDRAARTHLAGVGASRQLVRRDRQRRQSHDRRARARHCRRAGRRQNARRMARSPVRGPRRRPDPLHRAARRYWGELCGSRELASEWADRLVNITRLALSSDKSTRGYFHGTSACLSALFTAGRYDELIELVQERRLMVLQAVGCEGHGCTRATD